MPVWADFLEVLRVPLDILVNEEDQFHFSGVVEDWDLPSNDRAALRRWGLPGWPFATPEPQTETSPTLVPNVAGEIERQLIGPDSRLYRLGLWQPTSSAPIVGAVGGSGRVLGLREAPITTADIHRDLQPHYPNLYLPSVSFINSSVAQYVEACWRWAAAARIGNQILESGNDWKRRTFHAEMMSSHRGFFEGLARLDFGIDPADEHSLWFDRIMNG